MLTIALIQGYTEIVVMVIIGEFLICGPTPNLSR
jgi:hypothetical protein